ncbi:MAG: 4Fe-4S binding protein [Peptostreptococcales bacterium]|jgi:uncharacterized pyridoxamine 5'-phosphate oxidase family protein/Pyruvate/2-oxoacid:ferredoxin oxidoreductase delta subunit
MQISEIFKLFDDIGCVTFATVKDGKPETRIAYLYAYDDEGLYFRTMVPKSFYKQLKEVPYVSICGLKGNSQYQKNDKGIPVFEPGYTVRLSGLVEEVPLKTIKEKAETNDMFQLGVLFSEQHATSRTFVIKSGTGELYDFDFEMKKRGHKLLRKRFSLNGQSDSHYEVVITNDCVACLECMGHCTYNAIYLKNEEPQIDPEKCDLCGDCIPACEAHAIKVRLIEKK